MAKKKNNLPRAKTTEGLAVGMSVKIKQGKQRIDAVITYIYDRWSVGTNHGSAMANALL